MTTNLAATPPIEDHNAWADFWNNEVGVNVLPAKTKEKKVFVKWSEWQLRPIPQDLHDQWKHEGAFNDGMAIIAGKVWRGPHAGEYLIFLDCDNALAIEEFCTRNCKTVTIEEIAQQFIVEQHPDDISKAHVYFYSKIPFVKKSSDISAIESNGDQVPAIEIKGEGVHGLAYCTPSYHKNGHRYQIIGKAVPTLDALDHDNARLLMQHLDSICKKYGLRYLELDNNGNGNALAPITDLFKRDFVVHENHNRHGALLRIIESYMKRNAGIMDLEEIEELARKWNDKHCKPPLDDMEFRKQWNAATKWIQRKQREEQEQEQQQQPPSPPPQQPTEEQEQQQQQQPQQPPPNIELTEEITKEVTFSDVGAVLSTSIKKDDVPKIITFCGMLLAQTRDDQLTLGFQAESSAGKSYIPLEVSLFFPRTDIEEIASASPTAFYHDGGKWDPERKVLIVDLENKILIFMDMPHFQLLEKLRPMLSHDRKDLLYKITDKTQKYGIKTKKVIIRGYCSVFFCSTNADPDEQEKTRMILLSPSVDQEKLKETLLLAALRKSNPDEYKRRMEADPQRVWLINRIYAIRQGGIREVIVPEDGKQVYDRFMKEHPYLQPRHQRDLPRIFSLIKAHALLNCFKRRKVDGKPDTILCNQVDIDAAFDLYKGVERANELGLSPYVYGIYADVVEPMLKNAYYDQDGNGLEIKEIARRYYIVRHKPISPRRLKDVLEQLETVGLIRLDVDKEDRRQKLVFATALSKISNSTTAESNDDNDKKDTERQQ